MQKHEKKIMLLRTRNILFEKSTFLKAQLVNKATCLYVTHRKFLSCFLFSGMIEIQRRKWDDDQWWFTSHLQDKFVISCYEEVRIFKSAKKTTGTKGYFSRHTGNIKLNPSCRKRHFWRRRLRDELTIICYSASMYYLWFWREKRFMSFQLGQS